MKDSHNNAVEGCVASAADVCRSEQSSVPFLVLIAQSLATFAKCMVMKHTLHIPALPGPTVQPTCIACHWQLPCT
jgi:hypothetical protein